MLYIAIATSIQATRFDQQETHSLSEVRKVERSRRACDTAFSPCAHRNGLSPRTADVTLNLSIVGAREADNAQASSTKETGRAGQSRRPAQYEPPCERAGISTTRRGSSDAEGIQRTHLFDDSLDSSALIRFDGRRDGDPISPC